MDPSQQVWALVPNNVHYDSTLRARERKPKEKSRHVGDKQMDMYVATTEHSSKMTAGRSYDGGDNSCDGFNDLQATRQPLAITIYTIGGTQQFLNFYKQEFFINRAEA